MNALDSLSLPINILTLSQGLLSPSWYVGTASVDSSYCAFTPGMTVKADLTLAIGLKSFNVTYRSVEGSRFGFVFNNAFELTYGGRRTTEMPNKARALDLGLPNPMLIVAEYMDTRDGGFRWLFFERLIFSFFERL